MAALLALDGFLAWLLIRLVDLGYYPLAAAFLVIGITVNVIFLHKKAYPLRWMVVGLVLMALFTIYPILFTVWVAFTNYGEGHLITKQQAIDQLLNQKYLPEAGTAYRWTAFKSEAGDYALWLIDPNGEGFLTKPGEALTQPQPGEMGLGPLDGSGIPESIAGYQRLNPFLAAADKNITKIQFGDAATSRLKSVRPPKPLPCCHSMSYDPELDAMINQETGIVL